MAVKFIPLDRDTPHLFPPSIQDYLPDDHLVRFVVDIFDPLGLSALTASDSGKGSHIRRYGRAAFLRLCHRHVFLSQAGEGDLRQHYRFICANTHPDQDSICAFRFFWARLSK